MQHKGIFLIPYRDERSAGIYIKAFTQKANELNKNSPQFKAIEEFIGKLEKHETELKMQGRKIY